MMENQILSNSMNESPFEEENDLLTMIDTSFEYAKHSFNTSTRGTCSYSNTMTHEHQSTNSTSFPHMATSSALNKTSNVISQSTENNAVAQDSKTNSGLTEQQSSSINNLAGLKTPDSLSSKCNRKIMEKYEPALGVLDDLTNVETETQPSDENMSSCEDWEVVKKEFQKERIKKFHHLRRTLRKRKLDETSESEYFAMYLTVLLNRVPENERGKLEIKLVTEVYKKLDEIEKNKNNFE